MSSQTRINQEITASELRIIDQDGNQLGIMPLAKALDLAKESNLDLIEISPTASPPVAKIMDWGKFQYQRMKEQQKNRRKSKVIELKQIRLGIKIGSNDLEVKLRKIREFLSHGNKVKIIVLFRGREIAHQEIGYALIDKILSNLQDIADLEQKPQMTGRNLSIVIRSK